MRSVRTWVAWSVAAAVLLVSPVVAFLMVMAAEILIDLVIEAGLATVLCLVIAGVIGWALRRNRSLHTGRSLEWEPDEEPDRAAIAAPPT
jgi:hypothetical protein